MRRFVPFVLAALPLIPFAVTGCEDGPNQSYSPAPAGFAATGNGSQGNGGLGDGGAFVPTGSQAYDASFGGQNANDLCTATQEKAVWTANFSEPIQPPGLAAGIDIAGGPTGNGASGYVAGQPFTYDPTKETWTGTTVEQAEAILCQGTADSIYYGVTATIGWGESLELSAEYVASSRQITDLLFEYGYVGNLTAKSADGKSSYVISMNNVPISITAAGGTTQLLLDWSDPATFNPAVNALYDALRNTYEPTFPANPDCIAAGHCIIGNNFGAGGYLFLTPLNLAIFVATTVGTPQANSIPQLVDLGLLKLLPFSGASNLMKLDAAGEGPTSITTNIAGTTTTCKYVLGMTWADFDSQCLEPLPSGNPQNTVSKNKLFGGMTHSDEAYSFDIEGIDPQFTATLAPNAVVSDTQRPVAADVAYQLNIDQYELGTIANDFTNNDTTQAKDLHGLGLLTLEWANLVQQYIKANYGITTDLGDPACVANPAKGGCSGIEGIVTTAPPSSVTGQMKVNAIGPAATGLAGGGLLGVGLKPGTWYSLFCTDGGGLDASGTPIGYQNCAGADYGFNGALTYYFDTMQDMVALAFGGNPPTTLASRRFYFQQWILALVKYLQAEAPNSPAPTLAQIDANTVDVNNLYFDSAGGGFETAEYVFRNTVNVGTGQAPTAIDVTTNLTTSVINNFEFSRYNFRGEKALYTALTTNPADQPGAEALYLTNLVGSPVLASTYGTYACAINTDPTNAACANAQGVVQVAPLDGFGNPLYTGYAPAFGQSVLNIAANGAAPSPSAMTVNPTDFELIQSAMVTLPIWANPFDPSSAKPTDKTISVLLPYVPEGANVGFPVTIDGSRDKFYNTNTVGFSGETIDANVDFEYTPVATANGGTQNILVVRAIETQSYLGLVFACAQPNPSGNGQTDILAVRMYSNGQDILDWIGAHPGATTACGIEIKYSIYGNYADYISSLINGVRIGLNPGFGGSVVSEVTLFDPNVVASLGQ